ncbi:MAG TPA: SCO family protein [Chloroflexaceae bacterium]|nr:SCO family protein [Chloroflexaceae bacterium]
MQTSAARRSPLPLLIGALLLSLAIGGAAIVLLLQRSQTRPGTGAAASIGPAPSFALVDQLGRPVSDADLRGKVVVADFIYTTCTDICPALTAQMATLRTRLADEGLLGDEVVLLSISVDPARDTPEVLRAYSEPFGADPATWRFLTGDEPAIREVVVDGFMLGVEVMEAAADDAAAHEAGTAHSATDGNAGGHGAEHGGDYEVSHSGRFVLIDRDWQVRSYYDSAALDQDELVAAITSLTR